MESGPGGLGPVASEPKVKGSFPLPFLLPGRGTTALTEQTRVGAERRGGRKMLLCCCIALAVPPRVPQTFPLSPPRSSPKLCVQPRTLLWTASLRPSPHRLGCALLAPAAAQTRSQAPPQALCSRTASVQLGVSLPWQHPSPSAALVPRLRALAHSRRTALDPEGCPALLPGPFFPGPSPRPAPMAPLRTPAPKPHQWVPEVANIPALHATSRAAIDP